MNICTKLYKPSTFKLCQTFKPNCFHRSIFVATNGPLVSTTKFRPLFSSSLSQKPPNLCRFKQTYDINTNVAKDVILFKYENPKFYKILNAFSICQFFFWAYLSHFAYTTLKDIPVASNSDLPWWRRINLGENKYRNGIAIFSFAVGYLILVSSWLFTLRSVRFLVLRKGGHSLTFVTYGPFGKNRMTTIPLHDVSCKEARQNARVQLPLKVRNYWLHFILDMRGEFTNPRLFDHTAGLRRVFPERR